MVVPAFKKNVFRRRAVIPILVVSLCLGAFNAHAIELQFSGFGSVGAGYLDRSDVSFLDYSDTLTARSDTILAAQVNGQLSDSTSFTAQVASEGFSAGHYSDFEPHVEWLFVSHQLTPSTRVRLGRLRVPLFIHSENLAVGYIYPWARPPVDAYSTNLVALSNYDGVDLAFTTDIGGAELEVTALLGHTDTSLTDLSFETDFIIGTTVHLHLDEYSIRYSLVSPNVDVTSRGLGLVGDAFAAFSAVDPVFQEIADSHRLEDAQYYYHALGIEWERDDWSITSELNMTLSPDRDMGIDLYGWYFSVSKQLEQLRPYAVIGYSKTQLSDDLSEQVEQSQQVVPVGTIPELDNIRDTAQIIYETSNVSGFSSTIGARIDLNTKAALKFELQYFDSSSHFSSMTIDTRDDSAILSSIVLDFIF